jgi:hypothetical protein
MYKMQIWLADGTDIVLRHPEISNTLYLQLEDIMENEDVSAWELSYNGEVIANDATARDEDDGQPSEYEEWQDYMGGDDWDHGQYDDGGY